MSWKKEITGMCVAFAKAEDQSLTSEERKEHREKYLRVRTNLLYELQVLWSAGYTPAEYRDVLKCTECGRSVSTKSTDK